MKDIVIYMLVGAAGLFVLEHAVPVLWMAVYHVTGFVFKLIRWAVIVAVFLMLAAAGLNIIV